MGDLCQIKIGGVSPFSESTGSILSASTEIGGNRVTARLLKRNA